MNKLSPSAETIARQNRAADPAASAWVSANAGSGKTYVLSNRVIRLLLADVEPSKILCLTFTKAAAAHMSNKVFERLGAWAAMEDANLAKALADLGERTDSPGLLARARRLFARALDTPGGLKVLTIHAFCERLLHQFPFEARVPAAFAVLDDRQRDELVAAARDEVLMQAASEQDGRLGRALYTLVTETNDMAMAKALGEVLRRGERLADLMRPDGADASARVQNRLNQVLGVGQGQTVAGIDAEILEEAASGDWDDLAAWLLGGTANDLRTARCIEEFRSAGSDESRIEAYMTFCLTTAGGWRSLKTLATGALRKAQPSLSELIDRKFEDLKALIERRRAALAAERSFALLTVADAMWSRYEAEKARRGALDFADLIAAARRLLRDHGAAWVHYKLDEGVEHVLVDEAQDTSPEQWEIVQRLTAEFTAGESAQGRVRTIFAVGDEKQSIFGFQGAAPERFADMRRLYQRAHEAAELAFHAEPLTQSFRSVEDVLRAVDEVFRNPEAYAGLHSDNAAPQHETARLAAPGEVQVWPLIVPDKKADEEQPWFAPLDSAAEKSPLMRHAARIADAVKGWTEGRDALGLCPRISEGQILILVRSRGPLFEAILRELKSRNLKVAGADRLDVGKHIAALDLLALADALLLTRNDLQLASVLKSPLFGFDDEDLMRLAPERRGSLRRALRESAELKHREAESRLKEYARAARHKRPFDFFAEVLGAGGGRRAFRARLGGEVDDVLDEFLRLAMSYGETETATLAGFAVWMRAAPAEIKRDLETAGEDVRVMTVHGAKGLEAKLVVLADFGAERHASLAPVIYTPEERDRREGEAELMVWSPRKKDDPDVLAQAREAEKERERGEHKRLLYVGLTRAEDRLVIAAHSGERTKEEGSWHKLVTDALGAPFAEEHETATLGKVLVYRTNGTAQPVADEAKPERKVELPDWLRAAVPQERPEAERLAPSRAVEHEFVAVTSVDLPVSAIAAKERGVLLHRLLEELPDVPDRERKEKAWRYLARMAPDVPEAERMALAAEAVGLVGDLLLAPYLAAPGRPEVPVAGKIERPGKASVFVSGQIDRLIVEKDRVTVLDFKSDRPVPPEPPEGYVAQLALYRALLARIFPGKNVECALLWTAERRLDRIPPARLDGALQRVLGRAALP